MATSVIIVGGGVIGCALAHYLTRSGAQVTLLERRRIGQEASWATAGIISAPLAPNVSIARARLEVASAERYRPLVEELRDITGISVFDTHRQVFDFRPGAIFASIVVCDEINRASPKTQSAVLEAMEEAQVSVDGHTYPLDPPFLVIATQNPLEMEGTYPLPEAQRDRFMARISMGYPHAEAELAMLGSHAAHDPLDDVVPVTTGAQICAAQAIVRRAYAAQALKQYVVALVRATRSTPALRLGASPRASLHLLRAATARAALTGRDYVLPDDVRSLAVPVLEHRVLLSGESRLARVGIDEVLRDVLATVPVPGR